MFGYVDVVIDGKYEKENPTTLPWRGSQNQIKHENTLFKLKRTSLENA